MNKSSCKPICKPTKQMDLDAKLPNNLSSKKTKVADSNPKQDAELLCQIASTQPLGLFYDNKSEQVVSFQDQNASQDDHPQLHETLEQVVSFQDQNASHDDYPWTNEWQMPEPIDLDKSELWHSSCLVELHWHETIATHPTTMSQSYLTHHFRGMRLLQLMPQQSETIVPHSTKQSETIRTCSTHQIKQGFKAACLALFSTFCTYEISEMAVSVHPSQASAKQTASFFSTAVDSIHQVNTLYVGTVNNALSFNGQTVSTLQLMSASNYEGARFAPTTPSNI
jgi:hypothetical protein